MTMTFLFFAENVKIYWQFTSILFCHILSFGILNLQMNPGIKFLKAINMPTNERCEFF
jgi:hypothetical protein